MRRSNLKDLRNFEVLKMIFEEYVLCASMTKLISFPENPFPHELIRNKEVLRSFFPKCRKLRSLSTLKKRKSNLRSFQEAVALEHCLTKNMKLRPRQAHTTNYMVI